MVNNLNKITADSILIFEYFTASGTNNPSIISEACEIIRSLVKDLKDLDTYVLISKQFENIFEDFDFEVNALVINESLENWLNENVANFSRAMFIAAENNMNLYNLTKLIENNGVKLYCSDSYAVALCSDKYETFDYLEGKINQPITFPILLNPKTYWKRAIQITFDKINGDYGDSDNEDINTGKDVPIMKKPKDIPTLDNSDKDLVKSKKLIAKPRYGVDCENLKIISSKKDIDDLENIYSSGSRFVVQEFIEGDVCSVSLISDGKTAIPISLNKQTVEINENGGNYLGGYLPFEHSLKEKAFDLAKKACEFVPGIKGFVGVDIIINNKTNDLYLIELNSRFTTSYVGLQKVANFNIAKTTIDLLDEKIAISDLENNISFNAKVSFIKDENGILDIKLEN